MSTDLDTAIPKGSLVLVTGANGFVGSHIVDALLTAGYRVRGTARSASKLKFLSALWEKTYGPGKCEIAVVEDMAKEGAYDEAVKDVSGVAHVASVLSFSPKPEEVVDPTVKGTLSILRSAAKESSIRRFVLTSSSAAGSRGKPNEEYDLNEESWNEVSVEAAYKSDDNDPAKFGHVYAASKVLGEKAAWKFVKDEKPGFVLNSILPSINFGPILDLDQPSLPAASAGVLRSAFYGNLGYLKYAPLWFVDVRDTAILHVHALTSPTLSSPGARFWAVATPFNINDVLQTFRKLYPERQFHENIENAPRDLSRIDNKRATELLGGRWRTLEESIKANTEGL